MIHAHNHGLRQTQPKTLSLVNTSKKAKQNTWHTCSYYSKGAIISKYVCSKTIFVFVKILILYDKISIFAYIYEDTFERRYLEMIAHYI